MKTSKYHIIFSKILLICFVAGQVMIYAHQHNITKSTVQSSGISKNASQQTTVSEKCYLCDVMHHNAMVASTQVYLNAITIAAHVFKSIEYSFTSIQLIISGGRAPPISNYFV